MPDLELRVDDLAAADPAALHLLRDADLRGLAVVAGDASPRGRLAGAPPGPLRDADAPADLPPAVTVAIRRYRHLGVAFVHARLEGHVDGAVARREVEPRLAGNGVRLVHRLEARHLVVRRHRVRHLDDDRDLGAVAGPRRKAERREMLTLERRKKRGIAADEPPLPGARPRFPDEEPRSRRGEPEEASPPETARAMVGLASHDGSLQRPQCLPGSSLEPRFDQ